MKDYSRQFGSLFPEKVLSLHHFRDVDDTVGTLVKQYYTFMEDGNIAGASALYEANEALLKPYYAGMDTLNTLEEELYNAQLFALSRQVTILSSQEPDSTFYAPGSTWLKPKDTDRKGDIHDGRNDPGSLL